MQFSLDAVSHLVVPVSDPRLAPLLEALTIDYTERYGDGGVREMASFPAHEFQPPHGIFVILQWEGQTIAGGAYRRYDEHTAEIKRIWTHQDFRRRGLATATLTVLEDEASAQGYNSIYLSTGPYQPEALALYLARGYQPLFDPSGDTSKLRDLAFTKALPTSKSGETMNV
ncbi:GNAT family N-acetyltransferase [Glutamicibacter sp.]|uniref:GNAT family N-acetyltransferase n=1 Tax=Glutamicibacter sp. TaxID=1931995 RepID=UPI0028BDC15A|nr:GNAT family N-acetyltransferase [Glutamicibacter sp.]